jgi:hypothetical protein
MSSADSLYRVVAVSTPLWWGPDLYGPFQLPEPEPYDDDEPSWGSAVTSKVISMPTQPHAFGMMVPLAFAIPTTVPGRWRYIVSARYEITAWGSTLMDVLEEFWYEVDSDFQVSATEGYTPVVELGRVEGFLVPPFREFPGSGG